MNQQSFPPTAKVHFTSIYGIQEAELYSDLLQGFLDNPKSLAGEVHVEQPYYLADTEMFHIYIKFFPLKEEFQNVELCLEFMRMCLQREHIKLLKQHLGM
ncbi:MAG: hypothetical protein CVU60_15265 [Deltaproteobacteria bacterium HGW-Deltaproteobacteria-18]|nr:MAG: hypothetical protein CVU60_15265 [Deltaproteobacteria bacterium HGW-Deltaproteobacteria-18]